MPAFCEFFAGGGMARASLGNNWKCLFANDIDAKKAASLCCELARRKFADQDLEP
jgi:site-specific DNA-cytosine methylase